jgi:hypothetical protein
MRFLTPIIIGIGLSMTVSGQALAYNYYPPAGSVVLDLKGQALPTTYQQYTTTFTASSTNSVITFVFRHDPGWYAFDDASVVASGGSNLLANPGFESGNMNGWSYFSQTGVTHTGFVGSNGQGVGSITFHAPSHSGGYEWLDGATEGYDGMYQTIATAVGTAYTISFWLDQQLTQPVTATNFQWTSTNGQSGVLGNGIDILVYAGNSLPAIDPAQHLEEAWEPGTPVLLGSGLIGFIISRRGKTRPSPGVPK